MQGGEEKKKKHTNSHLIKIHQVNNEVWQRQINPIIQMERFLLLPAIWDCIQNYRLWRSNKGNITSEVSFPLQLQYISPLQITHVGIPYGCSLSFRTRVKHIKEILSFLKLQSQVTNTNNYFYITYLPSSKLQTKMWHTFPYGNQ